MMQVLLRGEPGTAADTAEAAAVCAARLGAHTGPATASAVE
jgi:hypothetical protein